MATTNMNMTRVARKLVKDNHLDEATAVEAVEKANKESIQLTSYLLKSTIVPSSIIAMISSQEFGLPVVDLTVLNTEMGAFALAQETDRQTQHDTSVQGWQQAFHRYFELNQHPGTRQIQVRCQHGQHDVR